MKQNRIDASQFELTEKVVSIKVNANFASRFFTNHFHTLLTYFLPVLPTLRLITSSAYLIPLPLYGSGLLLSLISAAYWPTQNWKKLTTLMQQHTWEQ